ALDIELGTAPAEVLATVRAAVQDQRKVLLDYYSFGRDETGERKVQPWRVFSSEGHWYLLAWCETAGGRRLFRVDRARSARAVDETFEPPADIGRVATYESRPGDPLVVLHLAPRARWVAERYPIEELTELADGQLEVRLRASSRAWLERLLLMAGPGATVISGANGVAQSAARRVLAVYSHVTCER
ncbi:MAG: helix-turn-helix transcriptional regulator, partial [Acidimicrobiales bacterium]